MARTITEGERVYQELRGLIVSGELRGGEVVNQVEVANRLGTSRALLHTAVARLVSERMLTPMATKGVRVTKVSVRDLLEINQLRWLLEGFAARVATEHLPADALAALRQQVDTISAGGSLEPEDVEAVDGAMHRLIAQHCGNERMQELIRQLDAEMSIARHGDVRASPAAMIDSVSAIVAAFEVRDADAAERELRAHIDMFAHRISDLLPRSRVAPTVIEPADH
ncbi:GntR family transcriptional regulator [Phytohabitans suffuscus]|uniref:HTH gntR-type domain-containing protein n=1 Tax=Phytohabitans suffuscus TaxID=624315 RepID=A0A6F8YDM9_9ACTN|nr:GntR family transcriptional regulator [Phytohabitans suffuscus]BCB84225.1 hypothetical protein Psuf_015380 [Phytohabitans suffuscus]